MSDWWTYESYLKAHWDGSISRLDGSYGEYWLDLESVATSSASRKKCPDLTQWVTLLFHMKLQLPKDTMICLSTLLGGGHEVDEKQARQAAAPTHFLKIGEGRPNRVVPIK